MSRQHKHPLFVLAEIDQFYRQQAQHEPTSPSQETLGLGLLINQKPFIISTANIIEIARIDKKRRIAPIPASRAWHLGLMSVRGQLVNIIDLSAYLMEKKTEIRQKTRIVMIRREQFQTGFMVDDVTGLLRADKDKPESTGNTRLPGKLAFACRRTLLLDGTEWSELDLSRLYADPEFARVTNS